MTVQVLHGDCLALLPTLPDNSIDAIVTDPPAGIAFMGKAWDKDKGGRDQWIAWMQQVAAECLRCMKPGGHALVWALPRTAHWTATAWENAGWEVRDVVHHVFGSGFPKSHNISVAIDRKLGAEREIVGISDNSRAAHRKGARGFDSDLGGEPLGGIQLTAPATPEAQQWQGWGTALKPACENWILLRKPLEGHTVAQNVLEHGTGGLNIAACRVPMPAGDSVPEISRRGDESVHCFGDGLNGGNRTGQVSTTGRWPPNLLIDGSEEVVECFPQARSSKGGGNRRNGKSIFNIGADDGCSQQYYDEGSAARFFPSLGYTEDELKPSQTGRPLRLPTGRSGNIFGAGLEGSRAAGTTTQGRWPTNLLLDGSDEVVECFPHTKSGDLNAGHRRPGGTVFNANDGIVQRDYGGDEGSAARFFPALGFSDDERRVLYCPKASKRDRAGSSHPTVKPIKLMEWLCKLICPPDGTILDPFAGSGTTGQAAMNLGFDAILIEQSEEYVADIQRRMGQSDGLVTFTR